MKNKNLFIIMFVILLVFSFYLFYKKDNKSFGVNSLSFEEESTKNDYFERNLECLKLRNEIEEKQEKIDVIVAGEITVGQIFYSPKANSCVYLTYLELKPDFYSRELYNVMDDEYGSKPLLSCNGSYPSLDLKKFYEGIGDGGNDLYYKELRACDDFDKKVEEYKK
ncbi:hypothetical protein ACFLY7_00855 [Patescibacteria group bacterium]